jgi:hypothetical protein
MVGAVVGNVTAAAISPSSASPAVTLKIADTSGIAAATSEPNMISNSTSARLRPMTSDFRSWVVCPIWPAPPPYSTCSPALVAGATALLSLSRYVASSELGFTFQATVAYATVPSLDTIPELAEENGLTALMTFASLDTLPTD